MQFLLLFFIFLLKPGIIFAAPASLQDFWNKSAHFTNEEIIRAGATWDYIKDYTETHDSGMAIIQDPNNPKNIYYLAELWKSNTPYYSEPHLYKSTDGGLNFTHVTKLFDVLGATQTTCPENSTYAYWNLNDKKYCLFQMREPDIVYYNNFFYILYEAVGKSSDGSEIMGPALIKLASLDITSPVKVIHGQNFRQHPILIGNYDGNQSLPGEQRISTSTPFWVVDSDNVYSFWTGMYPNNPELTWTRGDTYNGKYTRVVGQITDCPDPIWCFFQPNQQYINNPNLAINPNIVWEKGLIDGKSIVKENSYFYMLYNGSDHPNPNSDDSRYATMAIARSTDLTNWQRPTQANEQIILLDKTDGIHKFGLYGKLVKINGQYFTYFIKGSKLPGQSDYIARTYRMKLVKDTPDPDCIPLSATTTTNDLISWYQTYKSSQYNVNTDFNCDGLINVTDLITWYHIYRSS